MKHIAILTSGGDAPGMNAAVRAVVRSGLERGWRVSGVHGGYAGLIRGELGALGARDVGGIIQQGGTVLGSARSQAFRTEAGQAQALAALAARGVSGLVVVGGGGSQTGARALAEQGFPVVGVASTIDNDLVGSEPTLGVDTALNVALEAIDRLKVTASSHHRAFLVEVMGRDCGYLALTSGLAGGAEVIVLPEVETSPEAVIASLQAAYGRGKAHAIAVVAEGARFGVAALERYAEAHPSGFELRATRLGHVQRGGAPGAFDRLLGTRLGAAATEQLARGAHGVLVGLLRGEVTATPLSEVVGRKKSLDMRLLELARVMDR